MALPVYVLTIAGSTKTLLPQSLTIRETANGRNTMSFSVQSLDGTYRPAMGAEVILTEDGTRIFGGNIDTPSEAGIGGHGVAWIVTRCSAVDFTALIDRRVVTEEIPAGTLEDALDVLVTYLTDFGVTLDASQVTGPSIPALSFIGTPLKSAFDQLAGLSNYVYEIDYNKVLRMFQPSATAAPYDITTANRKAVGDVQVEPTREDYANSVTVLGGTGQQDVYDPIGTGDGSTVDFVARYRLAQHYGTVSNDGVDEPIGVTTPPYWTLSTVSGVTTATRSSAPAIGNVITFHYAAMFPVSVSADTSPAAADLVEKTVHYVDVFDIDVLQALADALVLRLSTTRKRARYMTYETGAKPGQTQTVTVSARGLSSTHLITDITITNPNGNRCIRDVTVLEGSVYPGSWRDDFVAWGGGGSAGGIETVRGSVVLAAYDGTFSTNVVALNGTPTPVRMGFVGQGSGGLQPVQFFGIQSDGDGATANYPKVGWGGAYKDGYPSILFQFCPTATTADLPLHIRYDASIGSGVYYVQPGYVTNGTKPVYLGNPVDSGNNGRFANMYGLEANSLGGYMERGRSVRMGDKVAVTFSAGDYTASSGNWTLTSPDQVNLSYAMEGRKMTLAFQLQNTSVSATPTNLRIAIPGGRTVDIETEAPLSRLSDNGTLVTGIAFANPGVTYISIYHTNIATTFATSTNATDVKGQIVFWCTTD
jgi:hypothetical protein